MTLMLLRLCANREQDEQRDGSAHDGLRNVRDLPLPTQLRYLIWFARACALSRDVGAGPEQKNYRITTMAPYLALAALCHKGWSRGVATTEPVMTPRYSRACALW